MPLHVGASAALSEKVRSLWVGAEPVDALYVGPNLVWGYNRPDTEPPTAPTNLRINSRGTSSLTLAWNAASDNVGVAGYNLYRGGSYITSVSGLSYTFSGLSSSTTYTLGVAAYDAAGNNSSTVTLSARTNDAPPPPPPTPTYPYVVAQHAHPLWSRGVGKYTLGTTYLDPARRYTLTYYGYCDSGFHHDTEDYRNSYVVGRMETSNATGSGPMLTVDHGSSYRYTTGSFSGGGSVTFYTYISQSYKNNVGMAGNPGVTVTCVG